MLWVKNRAGIDEQEEQLDLAGLLIEQRALGYVRGHSRGKLLESKAAHFGSSGHRNG